MKNVIDTLVEGQARIAYTKMDGSRREANASLNFATIYSSGKYPRSAEDLSRELACRKENGYFDLDKGEWRVFNTADVVLL